MAFTGRALYDPGVFEGVAEDVSEEIGMISPFETKLLDRLSQAPRAATNVFHEWLEESLNPNTVINSTAVIAAATNPASLLIHDGSGGDAARFFQVGHVFETADGEQMQVTAVDRAGDVIVVSRGFGGTTATTIDPGDEFFAISDAALEGADVTGDISQPVVRRNNIAQIFKKDVIISGTVEAVNHLGGIGSQMDHQRNNRLKESVRDLEKAVIRGRTSGNTIGSAVARRTMDGILARLTTNVTSTATLTVSILNDIIKSAWDNGGTDLDLIVADSNFKRIIDNFNDTRVDVANRDERFHNRVSFFESTYGEQEVQLNRWMPANSLMVISTQRIHVVPLTGRSFRFMPVSRTGDAEKGMIIGEYTVEIFNEDGMAQAGS